MIRLTRLRNAEPLYLNPDHIERLDRNHETNVHMFNGSEYIVTEDADTIVDLIVAYRGRILAAAQHLEVASGVTGQITAAAAPAIEVGSIPEESRS